MDQSRIDQTSLKSNVGSNATLECKSQEKIRWFFNNERIYGSEDFLIRESTLIIPKIKLSHNGYFTCIGAYENKVKYFYAYASFIVYGKSCNVIHVYT